MGVWLHQWFFNLLIIADNNKNEKNAVDYLFRKRYPYIIFYTISGIQGPFRPVHRPNTPGKKP